MGPENKFGSLTDYMYSLTHSIIDSSFGQNDSVLLSVQGHADIVVLRIAEDLSIHTHRAQTAAESL